MKSMNWLLWGELHPLFCRMIVWSFGDFFQLSLSGTGVQAHGKGCTMCRNLDSASGPVWYRNKRSTWLL